MKTRILIFLCLWLSLFSHAQILSIEKIKAVPQKEFHNRTDSSLVFPVFKMKNKIVENKINQKLRNDFKKDMDIDKKETNLTTMLRKASEDGLTDLIFNILYQNQKIICLNFEWDWMAAYPSNWRTFYCFNLETGNLITLDSIIEKKHRVAFLNLVRKKQSIKINLHKKTLAAQLRNKEFEQETYEWAKNSMKDNCWDDYNPQKFTIDKNILTIIIDCGFPHAIHDLSPGSDIKLPLKQIEQYLNKKYRSMLN